MTGIYEQAKTTLTFTIDTHRLAVSAIDQLRERCEAYSKDAPIRVHGKHPHALAKELEQVVDDNLGLLAMADKQFTIVTPEQMRTLLELNNMLFQKTAHLVNLQLTLTDTLAAHPL